MKGLNTGPFVYPFTTSFFGTSAFAHLLSVPSLSLMHPLPVCISVNGTIVDNCTMAIIDPTLVLAMSGVVPETQYQQMMASPGPCGIEPTPTTFAGFNSPDAAGAIYWAAPVMTHSAALLAVGKWQLLSNP